MAMYLVAPKPELLEKYGVPQEYPLPKPIGVLDSFYVVEISPAMFALLKIQFTPEKPEDCIDNVLWVHYDGVIYSHTHKVTFTELLVHKKLCESLLSDI